MVCSLRRIDLSFLCTGTIPIPIPIPITAIPPWILVFQGPEVASGESRDLRNGCKDRGILMVAEETREVWGEAPESQ
jgi:hypothetical protein